MWWFVLIGAVGVYWLLSYIKRHRLEARSFHSDTSPHAPVKVPCKVSRAPIEEGKRYTIRFGKSVAVDAVFDAWVSNDLEAMIAVIDIPTNLIERHHLLCGIVSGCFRLRGDPHYAEMCASTAEIYLTEMPKLLAAIRKNAPGLPLPHIPIFEDYAKLLNEQNQHDRAIEICEIADKLGLHDNTKNGYQGRIERIRKKQQKAAVVANSDVTADSPKHNTVPAGSNLFALSDTPRITQQAWQSTLSGGLTEIDRLVSDGDWDSARAALQRIAYSMLDADEQTKAKFTAAMSRFAELDPLFADVLSTAIPTIEQTPGIKQADLYRGMSDDKKELIRYVLYFAAELGKIVRVKSGNSYALYPQGFTPPLKAPPVKRKLKPKE